MAPSPPGFVEHLRAQGYHPRSNKHSNTLAELIVADLLTRCAAMAKKARAGQLVYDLNFTLITGTAEWNVDLVLGEPPPGTAPPASGLPIQKARPSRVQIAIEIKSVMTEHRKAIKNRKRDFEAHHDHVHRYNNRAIAGAVLVLNQSGTFHSPLRSNPTIHRDPDKLVIHCINEMRAVAERRGSSGIGLDAKAVIVLELDNADPSTAHYVTRPPAPQVGDPVHYDAFIEEICDHFMETF